MLFKSPSHDWTDEVECIIIEEENISDIEDEDFSEYMWMENEEEFDQTELQRLEDEECMRQCIEAMLDDELEDELTAWENFRTATSNGMLPTSPVSSSAIQHMVQHSKLNPLAAEFVPFALRSKVDAKSLTPVSTDITEY